MGYPLFSFGDSKGLGFYPAGAFGNEPYLAQAMMGIDVENNVYSAQAPHHFGV